MKKAFTLPELLIVLTLMGVIGAFAMRSFKPYEMKYKHLISNLYYHLDQAIYNGAADGCDPFSVIEQANCKDAKTNTASAATNQKGNSIVLCQALANYINRTEANCSAGNIGVSDTNLSGKTPHLKAANGIWLYIIANNGEPFSATYIKDTYEISYKYYLIYADLTGKKAPNTMQYDGLNSKSLPDTYTFAIIDTQRAIPLGALEIDKRLMTARVAYTPPESNDIEYTRVATSYIDAQRGAWDYYPIQVVTPENPHSFNNSIRNQLPAGHPARISVSTSAQLLVDDDADQSNGNKYNCSGDFIENCFIVVDKYVF